MDQAAQQGTTAWWRVSMVWLVIAGPLAVVIAGVATTVIAARGADPVVRASARQAPVPALAPAMQGRNHAATPRH
jgi:hypothetical protein